MTYTNKEKKKLTKWIFEVKGDLKATHFEQVLQYFIIFWIACLWDVYAVFSLRSHSFGAGREQIVVMVACILGMVRVWWRMKK